MQGLVDTHTHLDSFFRKGELDAALEECSDVGIERLVTIGTDAEDWKLYADLAAKHEAVEYSVGIHPCSVEANWEDWLSQIETYWDLPGKPVALGEIGLDRFHLPKDEAAAKPVFERQLAAFEAQLSVAKRLGCPVVVHSRGAFAESVEVIDRSGVDWSKVVFHCFSEGPGEMAQLIERGGWGSFTGIITFKNAESVRDAARLQGLDRLMIETDAPYLAPMPHRGKPNRPAYLAETARYCAELFSVSPEAFAAKTRETSLAFYGLQG